MTFIKQMNILEQSKSFRELVAEAHNRDMKVMIDFGVKYVSLRTFMGD